MNSIKYLLILKKIRSEIITTANQIVTQRGAEMWDWPDCSDDYWLLMISPSAKKIKPNAQTRGYHPIMAKKITYPKDKTLSLLYDYFVRFDKLRMSESAFQVFYGYLNTHTINVRYNPYALSTKTRPIIEALNDRNFVWWKTKFVSTIDPKHTSSEEQILSKKVPFFRNSISQLLNKYGFSDIEKYLKAKRITADNLFMSIESQWNEHLRKQELHQEER